MAGTSSTGGKVDPARDRIVRRAAKEFQDGMYVNLGKYCARCFNDLRCHLHRVDFSGVND